MNLEHKIELLAPASRFDACDTFGQGGKRFAQKKAVWGDDAVVSESGSDGRAMPVFRVLMSSQCAWDCPYCPLRSGNDTPRATLSPKELSAAVLPRAAKGTIRGVLLSTGVDGTPAAATQQTLDGVEQLRRDGYDGYVHVKLPAGAPLSDVTRAATLADRLSINLEAPSAAHLAALSPARRWHEDLIAPLVHARDLRRADPQAFRAGLATQFVVGAAGESDRDLLLTTAWLLRDIGLARVYYGAFRPAPGTPRAGELPTPYVRERRLREADWLLRQYHFLHDELPYDAAGDLPLGQDPKLAWALAHPERFPVEINTAAPEALLRVPGLGPLGVRRLLRLRRDATFREPEQLRVLGSAALRAADFLAFNGRFFGPTPDVVRRRYTARAPVAEQLTLW